MIESALCYLRERAFDIANEIHKLRTGRRPSYNGEISYFDEETIDVSVEVSTCGCCGSDTYCHTFPTSYLYDDSYIKIEMDKLEVEKATGNRRTAFAVIEGGNCCL